MESIWASMRLSHNSSTVVPQPTIEVVDIDATTTEQGLSSNQVMEDACTCTELAWQPIFLNVSVQINKV